MVSKYNQAKGVVNGLAPDSYKGEDFTNNFFGALDVSTNKKSKDYTRLSTKKLARDLDEDTFGLFNNLDKREQSRGPRQDHDSDDGEELEGWDEETTLIAMMHDSSEEEDEEEDLMALVERLRAPMAAQGQRMKQHMKDTVIPAIQQVKTVHETLDEDVDLAFGTGLLAFNEVCKRVEAMAVRDEDEIKERYIQMQKNAKTLFAQLEAAYDRRDRLWAKLEHDLSQCAEHAKAAVESLPAEIEETITRLEKKSKDMEKKEKRTVSNQKMLRELVEKM